MRISFLRIVCTAIVRLLTFKWVCAQPFVCRQDERAIHTGIILLLLDHVEVDHFIPCSGIDLFDGSTRGVVVLDPAL